MSEYNHKEIEKKWQERWAKDGLYQVDLDKAKNPFYNLMMFPYPSAEGLHVGNMYAFVHSDAYGRFMRLKGYDVFEPIGLDGFGIHSENYAIKIGEHIKKVSERTEKHFYKQLHMIGNAYDWSRTVETYKPNYYKWTQWLFLQMYKKGLAYRKESSVNWCPSCKTVLSDEQVISGHCERCDSLTEKKQMKQWFFRITDYAEKLLENLSWIDWSEEVKTIQKNWIGKSIGAEVDFLINKEKVTVFTTRPDTLFGATYFVLSPEHPLIGDNKLGIKNWGEVKKYVEEAKRKSELERTDLAKEKTGVRLEGIMAINPVNNEEIPVFIADYVLMGYGTGAIMAVPAHDMRDYEFAVKYNLDIKEVVKVNNNQENQNAKIKNENDNLKLKNFDFDCFAGDGIAVNSGFLDGLKTVEAKEKIIKWLEEKKLGKRAVNYKLRDWCVSRQRYWGPPIPMVYCKNCAKKAKESGLSAEASAQAGWQPVNEKDLPIMLPEMDDFLPDGSGKGPLNKIKSFVNTKCPKCGGSAERETDVSDPFVDSSWYYLRYLNTDFGNQALDKNRLKKWMPVDMYIGGKEHSVLHLLYSRFVTMVLHELDYAPVSEPYKRFRAHGLLIRDGAKISKSKGNIINPDEYIEKYGADAVRLYLMFLGDMRQGGDWRDSGMQGMHRFVKRIYALAGKIKEKEDKELTRWRHKTIQRVGNDLEKLKYNTAIAKLMALSNKIQDKGCNKETFSALLVMISPFAPHLAEELWERLGYKNSVFRERWPKYDKKLVKDDTIPLVLQVNGKVRDTIEAVADISEDEAKNLALASSKIKKWTDGKEIVKIIFVQGRLVNIVIK